MSVFTSFQIIDQAQKCIALSQKERPELIWLKDKYRRFQKNHGLKTNAETDQVLYQKMYQKNARKPHEYLKIRYWRTGRHIPSNRNQCILLGNALELSEAEMNFLIQNYYDRSINIYELPDSENKNYCIQIALLDELISGYLNKLTHKQLLNCNTLHRERRHYLRHIYFNDACQFIYSTSTLNQQLLKKHINSAHYDSEFSRQMKLLGEIPRKTMLRHLIILNLPDLTLDRINQQLSHLGYLPLSEEHTLTSGERLDRLLIQLITHYEEHIHTFPDEIRKEWFCEHCRILDYYFIKEHKSHLRFMYFKALNL